MIGPAPPHRSVKAEGGVLMAGTSGTDERAEVRRWLPSFLALSVVWGSSFALIKVGVDAGVSPLWVALWR